MASVLINIPGTGPVDPLSIKNAHYEYQQATTDTVDNTATLLYLDLISENGVYLYEVRVVGIESEVLQHTKMTLAYSFSPHNRTTHRRQTQRGACRLCLKALALL
jgi:hypothetical protein